jgi:tRNA A37 N6-isopentenylltransferase MiaA
VWRSVLVLRKAKQEERKNWDALLAHENSSATLHALTRSLLFFYDPTATEDQARLRRVLELYLLSISSKRNAPAHHLPPC